METSRIFIIAKLSSRKLGFLSELNELGEQKLCDGKFT